MKRLFIISFVAPICNVTVTLVYVRIILYGNLNGASYLFTFVYYQEATFSLGIDTNLSCTNYVVYSKTTPV